ncbi:hypothetical protein GCE86_27865 [Micromonospora terminaliae]|uniref:Uncharacterized protein n=1 Tax=Micromonospora terminaliae TaxID=1914461 RepID=A0AAJ2ZA68_9ACTN|nr:hypothetical protein [Micromonospora terminaliae]NES26320.1 hypothetical protein [Micromonospora terminaliae]QGL50500.1 hypothetical protein GCE86_27865 [Micromonospora terminaliae]
MVLLLDVVSRSAVVRCCSPAWLLAWLLGLLGFSVGSLVMQCEGQQPRSTSCHALAVIAQWRRVARISVAALVAMLCGACGTDQPEARSEPMQDSATASGQNSSDARITVPASYTGAGKRFPDVDPDSVRDVSTLGVASICLDRPGRVTINEIQPEMSTGEIRVEAFALVPWDSSSDGSKIPLSHDPAVFDRAVACAPDDLYARDKGAAQVALQLRVRKVGPHTAVAEQLVLRYTSGGHPYEFSLRWSIALCAPDDVKTRQCKPLG